MLNATSRPTHRGKRPCAPILGLSLAAAFGAGLLAAKLAPDARAQGTTPPPLTARIFETANMKDEEISAILPTTELRTRNLVVTEWGTVGIQAGNIFKHYHETAHEVQFIIEGTGTAWLGDKEVTVKPGDLVVIPKGVHHAGTKPASGRFKALAIKFPMQGPDDTKRVN